MANLIKRSWIGALALGIILVGAGIFMVYEGRQAHNDVRDTLAGERVVSSEDADIPLVPVTGPAEAKAQADAIRHHIRTTTGGKTYAELDRNDPNRAQYLNSITLRTALMESYMAFKTSDLVSGIGAIVILLGLSHVALGAYLGFVSRTAAEPKAKVQAVRQPVTEQA